jgi:drug/metabolite transporter (DMT)-like permease
MSLAPREKLGLALGIAGVFLFGGTLPATRLAVASIDPLFLTAARATIAGAAGLLLLLVMRKPLPPRALWGQLVLAALCTIVGFPVSMALAMTSVPAAHGGVVLGIMPLATVAAAALIAHERPSVGFWLASLAGALIVVVFVISHTDARGIAAGDLFLLGTIIAGAFGYTLSGRLSRTLPGWEVICWQVALFLPLSALAAWLLWPRGLAAAPAQAWAGLAYVSFVSQFFAFFVFNAAMAMGGVARVGQLMLLQPFVIVALAAPINGEPVRLATLAFAAAVVAAVLIGQRMRVTRG